MKKTILSLVCIIGLQNIAFGRSVTQCTEVSATLSSTNTSLQYTGTPTYDAAHQTFDIVGSTGTTYLKNVLVMSACTPFDSLDTTSVNDSTEYLSPPSKTSDGFACVCKLIRPISSKWVTASAYTYPDHYDYMNDLDTCMYHCPYFCGIRLTQGVTASESIGVVDNSIKMPLSALNNGDGSDIISDALAVDDRCPGTTIATYRPGVTFAEFCNTVGGTTNNTLSVVPACENISSNPVTEANTGICYMYSRKNNTGSDETGEYILTAPCNEPLE